jgi:hypothetical protein
VRIEPLRRKVPPITDITSSTVGKEEIVLTLVGYSGLINLRRE